MGYEKITKIGWDTMNYKWMKHTMAAAIALSLCVFSAGCSQEEETQPAQQAQQESAADTGTETEANTQSDGVVATVNGEEISTDIYQYYVFSAALSKVYQMDPENANPDFANVDWNQQMESGKTLLEEAREDALEKVIDNTLLMQKGAETGFAWDSSRDEELNNQIDTMLDQVGEEMFRLNTTSMGITSVDVYKTLYRQMTYTQEFLDDISVNQEKYISDPEAIKQYTSDRGATVQHVLILSDSEKTDDPQGLAQEICDRAKAGEDFYALMQEYNEDPGETEAGYTFGPGEMVKEFEEAAFALEIGQISDVVPSSYGYHVIKRLAGGYELLAQWRGESTIETNPEAMQTIDIEQVISDALEAQSQLQELQQSTDSNTAGAAE